jgi:hypothetical protein
MNKSHNIATFTCDLRDGFSLVVTMQTGKVITLHGHVAIDTFLEMVPMIAGEAVH